MSRVWHDCNERPWWLTGRAFAYALVYGLSALTAIGVITGLILLMIGVVQ